MTLRQLYQECVKLIEKTSETPTLDARIIAQNVLNIEFNAFIMHSQDIVSPSQAKAILDLAQRRASGEPVAYLIGHRGFYEEDFKVNSSTLIPRADTEVLVERAIELALKLNKDNLKILDLCCGTGCIGISVAKALARKGKKVSLILSDLSKEALEVCAENAKRILGEIGVNYRLESGNLFEPITLHPIALHKAEKFDLILTNPPYIATAVIQTLDEQVKREPLLALDGGADGLTLIKKIVPQAPTHLEAGGYLLMEIGFDQGKVTKELFEEAGFQEVEVEKDLGGRDRVVKGCLR